jgi:hypothetical protein
MEDKSEKKNVKKTAEEISCIKYWSDANSEDNSAVLIASSWDKKVRFYDDS